MRNPDDSSDLPVKPAEKLYPEPYERDGAPRRDKHALYLDMRRRIGFAVRRYRLARDLTLQDMARELRCSVSQVHCIEDMHRLDYNPRLDTIAEICRVIELSAAELFADPGEF